MPVEFKEKRKEARHALRTAATIQVVSNGEALSGTTEDVSSRGLLLLLDQHANLRVGDEVVCEVNIPGDSGKPQAAWATGKLVRVTETEAAILLTKGTLDSTLCQPCPTCHGSGRVTSAGVLCDDILRQARDVASSSDSPAVTLQVHPEIANELKARHPALVEEFQRLTKKTLAIEVDATLHWDHYAIR